MEVNGVEVEFEIIEENIVSGVYYIDVDAKIGDETCAFEIGLDESVEGSGIFRREADFFGTDLNNDSQRELIEWLQEETGCDEEDALDAMRELPNEIDLSDRFKENKRGDDMEELLASMDDETVSVLTPGIEVNDVWAGVSKTTAGEYIGTIANDCEVVLAIRISKKEFAALSDKVNGYPHDSHAYWKALMDGINALADLPRDED